MQVYSGENMNIHKWVLALVIVAHASAAAAQTAGDCDRFMKFGIYDKSSQLNSEARFRQIQEFVKNNQFESAQDARDRSAKLGLDISGILELKFSGKDSSTNFSEWKQEFERATSDVAIERGLTLVTEEKISDRITELVKACIGKDGVHLYVVPSADGELFNIEANYITTGSAHPATKVKSFEVSPADVAATCKPKPGALKALAMQGFTTSCRRRKDQTVSIALNTGDGTRSVLFEAYRAPKPSITFTGSPERINPGESVQLRWKVTNAEKVSLGTSITAAETVADEWKQDFQPQVTTEYRLVVLTEDGQKLSRTITVVVNPPPPVLTGGNVRFRTTDDDKDHDTNVAVSVRCGTTTIASTSGSYGKFDDNTDNGPFGLNVHERRRKADISGQCHLYIIENPNGNDEWHFNWELRLTFSDGSELVSNGSGNLDRDRNTLSKVL